MLSNMAVNGNNCHEAQSMPTNSDEVYIKKIHPPQNIISPNVNHTM